MLIGSMASTASPAVGAEGSERQDPDIALSRSTEPQAAPFVYNGDATSNPGWVAAIVDSGFYICSGTLIHANWVLTAAHCVEDAHSGTRINVGSDYWYAGAQRRLTEVHLHPGYDPAINASTDLAMVKLDAPVSTAALPVLASSPSWPIIDQPLAVVGWGEVYDNSPVPDMLQTAGVWVDSDSTGAVNSIFCNAVWVAASAFDDFCFGGLSWACRGDSGGPLVGYSSPQANSGPVRTIYGLTSFGDASGCSSAFWDSVAQSVGPHLSWINSFLPTGPSPGPGDELFFYRADGLYRFYDVSNQGTVGKPIRAGDSYTGGWSTVLGIDIDGDGTDEMFFYRDDGLYRFYDVRPDGSLGSPLQAGTEFTRGWDSIAAIDLDGDGQDEMFFYREDGLYRYYDVRADGRIGSPLLAGGDYTRGWSSITALDLDGDGQDEMFYYREDGLYRYYNIRPNGTIPKPIQGGDNYTHGWTSILGIDLEGDRQDEMFFYREDGLYRYYDVRPNGSLPGPISAGDTYASNWAAISAVDLGG